ncbi:MAG TPA: hypothetical protein VGR14_21975 [Verrucomicrobiae bacterium]|jgi:hypothetical protein|nr:hypothetical protein [Verrucomicrobiae bacterium]
MKARVLYVLLFLALACAGRAQGPSVKGPSFAFATIQQGREILTNRDDFVLALSPFDRAARMKTDQRVSEKDYLDFVARNILDWDVGERELVQSALAQLQPRLDALALPFPESISFIKTTGAEEGGAEYTRGTAIILPQSELKKTQRANLRDTIAHELFHVLSRKNQALKEKLYAVIGFQPCGEIIFPPELAERKLTNPDAPRNDHCIRLKMGDESLWAVPILFSKSARYDVARGGEFFQYLNLQFLVVERKDEGPSAKAAYDSSHPRLLSAGQVSGFYEQVGRNTGYIIHPEEILADNFKLFLLQQKNVPSPEILQKLGQALEHKTSN